MKGKFKKFSAAALGLVLALSLPGCAASGGEGGGKTSPITAADLEIWTAPVTQKVLLDEDFANKGAAELNIEMYRNEEEAGQLFITPGKDVSEYTVEVSDLKSGDNTLPSSAVTVYAEKYMNVTEMTIGSGGFSGKSPFSPGWYPDALLPFEKSVEYEENHIDADMNQAVYISVRTPKDQAPGKYTGTVTIDADGAKVSVPMSVTVWDWTVPDENHLKTMFGLSGSDNGYGGFTNGELDSTAEVYERYYDFTINFRVCPRWLPGYANGGFTPLDVVEEQAIKATKDPRISTYCLPHAYITNSPEVLDAKYHDQVITTLMRASIENDLNLFEKATTYFSLFDEAAGDPTLMHYATSILSFVKNYAETFDDKYGAQYKAEYEDTVEDFDTKYHTYLDSFVNMTQLYVSYYIQSVNDVTFTQDVYDYTWCPPVQEYNDKALRDHYTEKEDRYDLWWYTAMGPVTPFPNYHIDNWGWAPRVMSWEQFKYNVVGNLYWQMTWFRAGGTGAGSTYEVIQDLYNTPRQFPAANGDGFLFYPGKYYGMETPVASIRIHALRDGMEDYEALYALANKTDELIKAGAITEGAAVEGLSSVLDSMFTGTVLHTNGEAVDEARRTVASLLSAADNGAVLYSNEIEGSKRTLKVYAADGTTVEATGANKETAPGGGSIYTINADITGADSTCNFTVTKGGTTVPVSIGLGTAHSEIDADTLLGNAALSDENATKVKDGEAVTFTFSDVERQEVRFTLPEIVGGGHDSGLWHMYIKNNSDTQIRITVMASGSLGMAYEANSIVIPANGENELVAQYTIIPWELIGELKNLRLSISATTPVSVTISDMWVSK